jgi:uncharacterized membrane protein
MLVIGFSGIAGCRPIARSIPVLFGVALLVGAQFRGAFAAEDYTVVNLGALTGGVGSAAQGINNAGVVVGSYEAPEGGLSGFTYNSRAGSITDLGRPAEATQFEANDVNNRGVVVGTGSGAVRVAYTHAGSFSRVKGASGESEGQAINDAGEVVGAAASATGDELALRVKANGSRVDQPGVLTKGSVATHAVFLDINKQGVAVGSSCRVDFVYPGFAMSVRAIRGEGATLQDLGTPPGKTDSAATSINDAGKIVGYGFNVAADGFTPTDQEAFLLDGDVMRPLGRLVGASESTATGISNTDLIVGYSKIDGVDCAFVAGISGGMRNLNDLIPPPDRAEWHLGRANAVNDVGQIVGVGTFNGAEQAFLLNPISNVNEWFLLED